jgi:hypothetical protein
MKDAAYTPAFVTVKLLDIGLVSVYYFAIGVVIAKIFDTFYEKFGSDDYDKMNIFALFGDIVIHLFVLGVVIYLLRNIVEKIPSPLDGIAGFQHSRLKELDSSFVISVVLIMFQKNLSKKINAFTSRVINIDY